ncbi:MAG: hypothetical protein JKY50_20640 [Oleispira sp.]|nr:hypothetical protein [Oleispira sp.]
MASNTHKLGILVAPAPAHILPSYDPEAIAKIAVTAIVNQRQLIGKLTEELDINKQQVNLISDINDYLNTNEFTNIGNGSIFHKQCKDILKASGEMA